MHIPVPKMWLHIPQHGLPVDTLMDPQSHPEFQIVVILLWGADYIIIAYLTSVLLTIDACTVTWVCPTASICWLTIACSMHCYCCLNRITLRSFLLQSQPVQTFCKEFDLLPPDDVVPQPEMRTFFPMSDICNDISTFIKYYVLSYVNIGWCTTSSRQAGWRYIWNVREVKSVLHLE